MINFLLIVTIALQAQPKQESWLLGWIMVAIAALIVGGAWALRKNATACLIFLTACIAVLFFGGSMGAQFMQQVGGLLGR